MKKTIKNVIICIAIVFLICSSIYNVFAKAIYTEKAEIIETTDIANNYGNRNYYESKITEVDINLFLISVCVVIGGIIGLIISLKENSKVKYVLYFICGNIIFTMTWTIILCIIYNKISRFTSISFFRTYLDTALKIFIPYVIMYCLILYANILNNKNKVKDLNGSLKRSEKKIEKNEKEIIEKKKQKRKIIIIAVIIITILIVIIAIKTSIKTNILINYAKAINEIKDNYYVKIEQEYTRIKEDKEEKYTSTEEEYYNNGISLYKYNNGEAISYNNELTNEKIYIIYGINAVKIGRYPNPLLLYNHYFEGDYVRFWGNILLSFIMNIKETEHNGIKCYELKRKSDVIYIDRQTYLPIEIDTLDVNNVKEGSINKEVYTIKPNVVTDEDVQKPDITGMKEIE